MAIYVDPLVSVDPAPGFPGQECCHLIGDQARELHAFANQLQLKLRWFKSRGALGYYKLTPGKRRQALRLGALEIDGAEFKRRQQAARDGATAPLFEKK